eukprot:COSAG01_NODE_1233_length_11110_cov_13.006902_13_plen_135_part_00
MATELKPRPHAQTGHRGGGRSDPLLRGARAAAARERPPTLTRVCASSPVTSSSFDTPKSPNFTSPAAGTHSAAHPTARRGDRAPPDSLPSSHQPCHQARTGSPRASSSTFMDLMSRCSILRPWIYSSADISCMA